MVTGGANRQGVAIQLSNLGLLAARKLDYDEAERLHLRALEIFSDLRSIQYQAMQYENIARIYRKQRLFDKSKLMQLRAYDVYSNGKFPQGLASVALEAGLLDMATGDIDRGIWRIKEAIAAFHALGLEADVARARRALDELDTDL